MSITPTALTGLLVADTYTAPNGGPDSIPSPTEVNGQPVDAVLELQSTTRGLLAPRMTTIQRNALVADDGFIIYNLTTNEFNLYANGAWGSVGAGSVIGPGVSVAGDIAIFADNTGTVIADSGVPITQVPAPLTHLLRNSFLSTVNQIGNLGHVKFVNGVGLVFVDALMPVEFIDNNYGPGSQVCSLFTGDLPSSSTTPSCLVELQSTTGALVVSRMTTAERLALFATNGMMVYDTTANIFYVYQGGIWNPVDTSGGSVTQINEGTGITCSPNPIVGAGTISLTPTAVTAGTYTVMNGTVNAEGQLTAASSATVITDTTGTSQNLFIGIDTGVLGTTSVGNCAVGCNALLSNNQNFPLSSFNSAFGSFSLPSNSSGSNNSAFGYLSLGGNTSGGSNCAVGSGAMRFNTTGSNNCAVGDLALASVSSGSNASSGSCALGYQALYNNSAGGLCAFGYQALYSNVSAIANSAFGYQALTANTSGASNNAFGSSALIANTVGANNSAFGPSSLFSNIGGSGNSALGSSTLSANINGNSNSAVGYNAGASQASYTNCSFFGAASDASVSGLTNSTAIGAGSSVAASNSLVLGSSCNVGINQSSPAYTLHISNVSSNCSIKLDNTTSVPTSPVSGGILYTSGNNLFYANTSTTIQISGGTVTQISQGTGITCSPNPIVGAGTISITNTAVTAAAYTVINGTVNAQGQFTAASSATRILDSGTNTFVGFTCGNNSLTGNNNLAVGKLTSQALTSGGQNTVFGQAAGNFLATGFDNSAFGFNSLQGNISGTYNSAFGASTLINNTGSNNTAIGGAAGSTQVTYTSCTFLGYSANASSSGLTNAIAIGAFSSVATSNSLVLGSGCNVGINQSSPAYTLHISNVSSVCAIKLDDTSSTPTTPTSGQGGVLYTSGDNLYYASSTGTIELSVPYIYDNEANYSLYVGLSAGKVPSTGGAVTALGVSCLNNITSSQSTSGYGAFSLNQNTSGSENAAFGNYSLFLNSVGSNNTGMGYFALGTMSSGTVSSNNTGVGSEAGALQNAYSACTFLGYKADASVNGLTNAIAIGANASVSASNSLVLGNGCNVGIGDSAPASTLSVVGSAQIGFSAGTASVSNGLVVSGNVGIGTNTPNAPLQFSNSFAGVNRILALYQSLGNNQHQFYGFGINAGVLRYQVDATTDSHVFYAAASSSSSNELFRITGGGSVGIGGISPTTRLEINGVDQSYSSGPHIQCITNIDAYPEFQLLAYTHNNIGLNFDAYWNGSNYISSFSGSNFQINKNSNQLQFNYNSGTAQNSSFSWSNGLSINTSGQVGIGKTTQNCTLDVQNNGTVDVGQLIAAFGSTTTQRLQFYDQTIASTLGPLINFNAGNVGIIASNNFFAIMPGSVNSANARVGINTTTPGATLHVNGPIITAPPASSATTVALGTAYQNTLGYDVLIAVHVSVTASIGGSILSGVGPTNTPTQQTVFSSVTGTACVSAIVPNNYYLKISTSGTITAAIAGQQATAL